MLLDCEVHISWSFPQAEVFSLDYLAVDLDVDVVVPMKSPDVECGARGQGACHIRPPLSMNQVDVSFPRRVHLKQ